MAIALIAAPSLCRADAITYSVATFSDSFADGSSFTLLGTTLLGPQSLNLTPGVSQSAHLDFDFFGNGGTGTFPGTATGDLTIDGVTESISDAFTFRAADIDFSGGAAVVFDLGTFDVTVTPISSSSLREANFLETTVTVPEPPSLALLASSGLFAALALARRSRPKRHMPDRA
jgi:hypothetical protein